ncbi:MAG: hypothetical protein CVV27_02620 [Candidatus Melainabacteria bacterium HGW-Melainabacteria-1]|nr:MAG: hypothetical protein CVV27_02620 [Candidatus Melainabacteria bacterium HGW-Melainabacteria-1]
MVEIRLRTEDLLNFKQTAKELGVTRVTVYKMIDRGELHPVIISDRRYLRKVEVEQLKTLRAPGDRGALDG